MQNTLFHSEVGKALRKSLNMKEDNCDKRRRISKIKDFKDKKEGGSYV